MKNFYKKYQVIKTVDKIVAMVLIWNKKNKEKACKI